MQMLKPISQMACWIAIYENRQCGAVGSWSASNPISLECIPTFNLLIWLNSSDSLFDLTKARRISAVGDSAKLCTVTE